MAMMASGIDLNPELAGILGKIQKPQSQNISSSYARLRGGVPSGSDYATERFNKLGGLSQGGLKTSLEGVLGSTSYGDWKNQRDYEQNYALAQRIGALNAPSVLQQVLGGLGAGAETGGQLAGLYNSFKKPSGIPYTPTSTPNAGSYGVGYGQPYARTTLDLLGYQ